MSKRGRREREAPQFTLLAAEAAIEHVCRRAGMRAKRLSEPARQVVAALSWQTNVAELETVAHELVTRVPGGVIDLGDVLNVLQLEAWPKSVARDGSLQEARKQWEREYILAALKHHHGHMRLTAKSLGIERTNLYRKLRELQIPIHRFDANGIGEGTHSRSGSNGAGKRPRGRPRRRNRPAEVATAATRIQGPAGSTAAGPRSSSHPTIEAGPR